MIKVSVPKPVKAGVFFICLLVAGSFVFETLSVSVNAQTQPTVKRKFGPGQNVPRGVRPQQRAPVQPRKAATPPPDVIAKEGKWIIQCDAKKPGATGAAAKKRDCGMLQTAVHKTNKRLGLTLILARVTRGKETATMMRILAPIGVYLPTGIALEVDGTAAGRVPFSRCDPRFCVAFAQVRKETLSKMRKGKKGKFLIYEAPGIGVPLDLDLAGFTAALKALDKTLQ